jgi:hypothetical protein
MITALVYSGLALLPATSPPFVTSIAGPPCDEPYAPDAYGAEVSVDGAGTSRRELYWPEGRSPGGARGGALRPVEGTVNVDARGIVDPPPPGAPER